MIPFLLYLHIVYLTSINGIRIEYIQDKFESKAFRPDMVQISKVVDVETYAIALHEIGHIMVPPSNAADEAWNIKGLLGCYPSQIEKDRVLNSEAGASIWGYTHALAGTKSSVWDKLSWALGIHREVGDVCSNGEGYGIIFFK